jgi:hypothetical protein
MDKMNMSFPELMEQELFEPLSIENSTFEQENLENIRTDIAMAHLENGEMVEGGYHLYPEMAAAGLWATSMDYAKIVCEIQKSYVGESTIIMDKENAKNALSRHWDNMGLGFIMSDKGDRIALSFSGGNHGYTCDVYSYLHLGSGAVIMTNSDNGGPLIEEIYSSISQEYNWAFWKPDTISPIILDTSIINEIKGSYVGLSRDDKEFSFTISGSLEELVYQTKHRKYPMYSVSKDKFVIPEQDWKLWILKHDNKIDSLRFKLGYGRGIAKRKK